jgi:apolipoprotein N-acyltransferase
MTGGAAQAGPVVRLADRLRGLTGWRRAVMAILAGALAALSLPPANALPVLWVAIPGIVWLLDGAKGWKAAFWLGWCFGFGYLATSLYWLTFALFVAIDRYWWLIPFASNGLAAGLAIYAGLAAAAASYIPHERPLARTFALVAMWSLFEWLRGHLLTGFPWNLPGYAWAGFPWLMQTTAWIGIYGVTVLVLLAPTLASLLGSRFASPRLRWITTTSGLVLVAVAALAGYIRLPAQAMAVVPDVHLRLVQPNIPQSLKWVEGRYRDNLERQIVLSRQPAERQPTAIIWSEAAEPYPLDDYPDNAKAIGEAMPQGALLITGIARDFPEAAPPTFRDSIQALDDTGRILATYDKFHYVPFGEYMPLSRWLPLAAVATGSLNPTPGPGPVTIDLPGLPPAGPLICYEVIFPHEVVDPNNRPEWLLDVTNDAWFGLSAGPYQHFNMMQVRAVEEGLPLVNAANDGISGVIDPYGRVVARLGLGKTGIVDADLPKSIPPTLYARLGDLPFFGMVAALALAGLFLGKRRIHKPE